MYNKVSGTKDILPPESLAWQEIEDSAKRIFAAYNYGEIRFPLIEEASLFSRSLGDSTEIVQKQMFLIKHGKELYALRPEGTASVVRAYLENNLDKKIGFAKFYYIGPMFRAERPQRGRLRQFHHIGCEVIGSADPGVDVEVISLAGTLLKAFGNLSGYKIKLNTLGCPEDKKALVEYLRKALKDKLPRLCDDCKKRFKTNVFRILDCKDEGCSAIVKSLDFHQGYLCNDCQGHFKAVKAGLDALAVKYEFTPYLVRGLDYYTRTVFEISHPDLGAQDALCAGGRYDKLVQELGGPDLGAMGFALGVDRVVLLKGINLNALTSKKLNAYIIPLGENAKNKSIKLLSDIRSQEIIADMDYENKSLKGAMRKANDLAAKYVLIIGEDELRENTLTLKDMASGQQKKVAAEDLIKELKC